MENSVSTDDLSLVNREVNASVSYVPDSQQYRCSEYWECATSTGDCEDYAIAKLHALLDKGWSIDQLALATCWVETGEYHAVLVVTDPSGIRWVLDNRYAEPYLYSGASALGYKFDKLQVAGTQQWVMA